MRVLHVIARLNVGGTARYITQLASQLPQHGIETFVATGFVQGDELEDPSAATIELIRIPALGRSINPIKDHLARKQLETIIAQVKPDIIHTHTFKAGYITRMKKQQIPVIHTFHGHLLDDPEFSGFKSTVIIAIERMLAKKSAKLVTVGETVGQELLQHHIGVKEQYISIAPGVVALQPTPRTQALANLGLTDNGQPIVGWIARVTGVKNPMRALDVARVVPNAHFVIAGGGDLLEDVKTAVALIEAQLAGKPVVATDVGSVSEVIANHETGLVTNKNPNSIAAAVNTLILDVQKHTAMSALAASRAQALFSVDQMINAHIGLYKSIVK